MARRNAIHEKITCKKAPMPVGPYAQAVRVVQPGEMVFVSGQIPIEVPSGQVFRGDIQRQTEIAMNHLKNILSEAGFSMDELVKCSIFVRDMNDFAAINEIYQGFFTGQSLPARAVVEVSGLPKDVGVEIEGIAMKAGGGDTLMNARL